MNHMEKAARSIQEAIQSLREKSPESVMVERYFLLYEAWDMLCDQPQPIQFGKGLHYILSRASLPICGHDLLLGRYDDHVPDKAQAARLNELWLRHPDTCPIVQNNGGHLTLDWESLIKDGIPAYLEKTERRIALADQNEEGEAVLSFLTGMRWVYQGILLYIQRYGEAAKKAGLQDCADVCCSLLRGEPHTFREGLQLILFVYTIYLIYAGRTVACLNVGRLDDILLPLYLEDLNAGRLTEQEAGALIDDFSAKMSLHLGRGEHQLGGLDRDYICTGWLRNHVFDSPGYLTIGGYSATMDHAKNPLTLLFAKHIHAQLKNPIYVCRYTAEAPDEVWDVLCEKIQQNAPLLLYNDETVLSAYRHTGIEREYAINYSVHPCNWADISKSYGVVDTCDQSLPGLVNEVLYSGASFESMDEIYQAMGERYTAHCRPIFDRYRSKYAATVTEPDGTLSFDDCFMDGPLERARGIKNGGVKYPLIYVRFRNVGTAVDMLSAVDTLVFRKKVCTLSELLEAADGDFVCAPELLGHCRKAPKYGTDHEDADLHAVRLMNDLLDIVDRETTSASGQREVYTLNVTINDSNHVYDGMAMNATVDGRRKGTPLSENLSGTVGYSKGVTALFNSVTKLPFDRIHSGALNVKIDRKLAAGETGRGYIKALLTSYFEQGGMQLQFSITDTEELRAAQKYPDLYRDLMVRITGYSAIFVDMSKKGQEEFIRREELR